MPEQAEALEQPGVLDVRSLVFSAPTSAGKSAVAEVLALPLRPPLQPPHG